MAVQQVTAFEPVAGGRDALLEAIGVVKAAAERAGATVRVTSQSAGPSVGNISAAFIHEDWEALAVFAESNPEITQPVRSLLRSANPPARVTGNVIRAEMLPKDSGAEQSPFTSALIYDPGSGLPTQAGAELGGTRDVFESLGANSQIWTPANGPNVGRAVIASGFANLAEWARFRERLLAHNAAGNVVPMGALMANGTVRPGGIIQSTAIDM